MQSDLELFELARRVGQRLLESRRRAVTAESCTGGWIAKALTDVAGSSAWFDGGFVTYANAGKIRDVGVAPATLAAHGAVSEAVVREMAVGALQRTGADLAVAVSGVAGPAGGTPAKPVGMVCFAIARRVGEPMVEASTERYAGDREAVRRQAVARALGLLLHA